MTNLYETLDIPKDASQEDIKKAYRKKSKENHPDKVGENEKIKDIILAYQVLGDEARRKKYDQTGAIENDSFEKKFNHYVQSVFISIIENVQDERQVDLIKHFEKLTRESLTDVARNIIRAEKRVKKFESVISRIKPKNGGENKILMAVQANLDGSRGEIPLLKEQMEFFQKCLEVIATYEYKTDEDNLGNMLLSWA